MACLDGWIEPLCAKAVSNRRAVFYVLLMSTPEASAWPLWEREYWTLIQSSKASLMAFCSKQNISCSFLWGLSRRNSWFTVPRCEKSSYHLDFLLQVARGLGTNLGPQATWAISQPASTLFSFLILQEALFTVATIRGEMQQRCHCAINSLFIAL